MTTYDEVHKVCKSNPDALFFATYIEGDDFTTVYLHGSSMAGYFTPQDVITAFGVWTERDTSEEMHRMAVAHGEAYDEDAEYYDPMGYNTDAYMDYLNRD